jgi:hypothetical protein
MLQGWSTNQDARSIVGGSTLLWINCSDIVPPLPTARSQAGLEASEYACRELQSPLSPQGRLLTPS